MLHFLLACTEPEPLPGGGGDDGADDSATDDSALDDSATDDSAPPDDSASDDSATPGIIAAATDGTLHVPFDASISGAAAPLLGEASIVHDIGPITVFGEKQQSVIWTDQLWSGITLYFTLSIPDDGHSMNVTYFYCHGEGLGYVYALGFGEPLAGASGSGKCPRADTAVAAEVHLPALRALPDAVATDIAIDGHGITLEDGAGTVDVEGNSYDFTPFATVDCSGCGTPGWYELHVVMTGGGDACYGVVYLFPETPDLVQLAWTLCVPSRTKPGEPKGVAYAATWSGSFPPDIAPVAPPSPWHPPPGR